MDARIARLFVLLGLSPGVLHSVLCAWRPLLSDDAEVVILATDPDVAERAVELASTCPCPGSAAPPAPGLRTRIVLLERGDVDSPEALEELRGVLERERLGRGDGIDVTGGRKLASVAAALYAASRLALVGYTWIPSDEYRRVSRATGRGCGEETVRVQPRLIAPLP